MNRAAAFMVLCLCSAIDLRAEPADTVLSALAAKNDAGAASLLQGLALTADFAQLDKVQAKGPEIFSPKYFPSDFVSKLIFSYPQAAAPAVKFARTARGSENPYGKGSWEWTLWDLDKAQAMHAATKDAATKKAIAKQIADDQATLAAILQTRLLDEAEAATLDLYFQAAAIDLAQKGMDADGLSYVGGQVAEQGKKVLGYLFKAGIPIPEMLSSGMTFDSWGKAVEAFTVFSDVTLPDTQSEFETEAEFNARAKEWERQTGALVSLDITVPARLELGSYNIDKSHFELTLSIPAVEDHPSYSQLLSLLDLDKATIRYYLDRKAAAFFKEKGFAQWTATAVLTAWEPGVYGLKELQVRNGKNLVTEGLWAFAAKPVSPNAGPAMVYVENYVKERTIMINGTQVAGAGSLVVIVPVDGKWVVSGGGERPGVLAMGESQIGHYSYASGISTPITADKADFLMSNGAEPTIDPSLLNDVASTNVGLGLFEGLMQYDPVTNKGVPAMAESYTVSPDGLTVTFKLRKAQWSDGTPVTAGDFVFGLRRILDPRTAADYAYLPGMVIKGAEAFTAGTGKFEDVGVKAIDNLTLQYTLSSAAPYFIDMTAHNAFWPIPRWAVEKFGTDWTKPANIVTNGPYTLKEWKAQEYVFLVKNNKYWDAKNVKLRGIKILASDKDTTNYNMFKNGEVDWMHGIANSMIDEIKLRPDYQASAQVATYYYELNTQESPTDDPRVRKALAMSVDKQTLVDKVTRGGQIPTDAMVPPMAGYKPQPGSGYDIEVAQKLLAQAGYANGYSFPTLTIVYNTNEGHKAIAEYIQQQWKTNLGINVVLKNMEFGTLIDLRSRQHDFTIARAGWVGDYLDPNTMLDLWITGAGNNDVQYANPEFDKLIKDAAMSSGADRMGMLQQAEAMLLGDQAIMPIYHYANQDLVDRNKWGGWNATPLGFHPFKYIYKK